MCECYADEIRREIAEQERKAIVADLLKALELATDTPASIVKVVAVIMPRIEYEWEAIGCGPNVVGAEIVTRMDWDWLVKRP